MMETYIGYIKSPQDALVIFEACRQGHLNRVQRRLSSKERTQIRSGSIFAFDESEAGMRRWTDGLTWSPSRVLGSFLTYRELDTKRRPRRPQSPSSSHHHHHHHHHQHHHHHHQHQQQNGNKLSCQSMCSYKQDGLIKQSFSICTADNQKLHLISYYNKRDVLNGRLQQPSMDPALGSIVVPKGVYPDLNPLDTSGGHSATLHNMRQQVYQQQQQQQQDEDEDEDDDEVDSDRDLSSSAMSFSPPSLSSSPCTSDEDINMDLLPSPTYSPFHPQLSSSSSSSSSQHYACLPTLLPIQEIAWEKIPSSEDQRQLQAIQGLLKL